MKTLLRPFTLILILLLTATWPSFAKKKKTPPKAELTEAGKALEAQYEKTLSSLKKSIIAALPKISKAQENAYQKALADEEAAKRRLMAANKKKGMVKQAQGLIGHAKGKWIGGANKGIANAQKMLKAAKNDAERQSAQKELAKWQKNKEDGLKALKEREAMLARAKAQQPQVLKEVEAAKKALAQAKANFTKSLESLNLNSLLMTNNLDSLLVKYVAMKESTPNRLAAFAEKSSMNKKLVNKLFSDTDLLKQMLLAGGAKDGRYDRAMQIYSTIYNTSSRVREKDSHFQKLAIAISLEHAVPIKQRNPANASSAPENIDPLKRYLHYEKAYLNKELDPAFKFLNIWDYRMVVNGNEPDEILAWGREMLRNYRPDHISTDNYGWRYVALVKTDIRYGSQDNKFDQPELQFFQNILMNGGVCGRRAFIGRFILRTFGIPTIARPQKGHAALAHWTPKGWVINLGAGWGSGWAPRPYSCLDFLAITQARQNPEAFKQVKRAAWIGDVMGEERRYGLNSPTKTNGFWNGVSLNVQRKIIEESDAVVLDALGSDIAEANESRKKEKIENVAVSAEDKKIIVNDNGTITIPAVACSHPTKSSRAIKFMKSHNGGMQLNYERGGKQDFTYTFNAPTAGKYRLTVKVATPAWKQNFIAYTNNSKSGVTVALPFTVGVWRRSKSVEINIIKGKNTLKFSRAAEQVESGGRYRGVAFKEFVLTPVK